MDLLVLPFLGDLFGEDNIGPAYAQVIPKQ